MATSGTTAFDLNIDDIIEEAYERIGMRTNSGHDLRSARRSLNLLFSEWGNRGIHLWKVSLNEIALVAGTAQYAVNSSVNDVLEAYISTTAAASNTSSTNDISLTKIDRSAYAALPNKLQTGQPSQYFVDRSSDKKTDAELRLKLVEKVVPEMLKNIDQLRIGEEGYMEGYLLEIDKVINKLNLFAITGGITIDEDSI